ncbi:uncharacterized protein LOC127254421 [Andrographis paniculata]|uniref:uncharacterized protein LOC127254421 n=1 Tax=Andrographis paniculata TaxID=175694 RepID=UPI0021E7A9F0|nr:uncharacterized protein LOC127254421 [Andrographis paniculata]
MRKTQPQEDARKLLPLQGGLFSALPMGAFQGRVSLPSGTMQRNGLQCSAGYRPQIGDIFAEKSRFTEERVSKMISTFQEPSVLEHHTSAGAINGISLSPAAEVILKDKFPNEVNQATSPKFGCLEPMQEGFLFGNTVKRSMNDATIQSMHEVKLRDVGTDMTPLGSSTTSRCPTPFKSTSPARHNTPNDRSGPLAQSSIDSSNYTIDITQLQECHMAKLQIGTQFDSLTANWSSREEEEEEISKSLRHYEVSNECRRSVSETKACAWEEETKTKSCLRYQREEAKIQAWVNLQSAKAEAESRKLELQNY